MTDTTNYINLNKNDKDPTYRYKMPEVEIKIEGNGSYFRTIIPNLDKIAMSLLTTPEILNHYLGLSLGTNSSLQTKSENLFIRGEYSKNNIQKIIYKYIDEFLICPQCNIPDTYFKIPKKKGKNNKTLSIVCQSCGKESVISNSKIDSKMINYIISHPPDYKNQHQIENKQKSVSNFGEMFSFDTGTLTKTNTTQNIKNEPDDVETNEEENQPNDVETNEEEEIEPSPICSVSSDNEIILKEVIIDLRPELTRQSSSSSSSSSSGSDVDNENEYENEIPEANLFQNMEINLEIEIGRENMDYLILEIASPKELQIIPERSASPLFKKPVNLKFSSNFSYDSSNYKELLNNKSPIQYENKYASLSNQFASRLANQYNNDTGSLLPEEVRELLRISKSNNSIDNQQYLRGKQEYLYKFLTQELSLGDDSSPYTDFNFSIKRVKIVSKHLKLESLVAGLMTDILVTRDCHGFHRQIKYFSKYFMPFIEETHSDKAQINVLDALAFIFVKRQGDLDIDTIIEEFYLNNIIHPDVLKDWFLNGSKIISDNDMEDVKHQLCGIIEHFMHEDENISDSEEPPPNYFHTMIQADGSVCELKPQIKKTKKIGRLRNIFNGLINNHNNSSDSSNSSSSSSSSNEQDEIMPDLEYDEFEYKNNSSNIETYLA